MGNTVEIEGRRIKNISVRPECNQRTALIYRIQCFYFTDGDAAFIALEISLAIPVDLDLTPFCQSVYN